MACKTKINGFASTCVICLGTDNEGKGTALDACKRVIKYQLAPGCPGFNTTSPAWHVLIGIGWFNKGGHLETIVVDKVIPV